MRIEFNNIFNVNKSLNSKGFSKSSKFGRLDESAKNTDVVEISSRPSSKPQSLSEVKQSVIDSIGKECDPERLDAIKAKVQSGSYNIPSKELAASVLGRGLYV